MALLIPLVYILIAIVAVVSFGFKFRYQYWAKRDVPYVDPVFPFGLQFKENGKRRHFTDIAGEIYSKFKKTTPFVGTFFFLRPIPLILDLDLVHHILVKDFDNFSDRGIFYNERDDPLSAHLFSMQGQSWKNLRMKLTPTFSSGEIKFMFPTILKVAADFEKALSEMLEIDNTVEIKDILARFTTDIIGTCAFGIECNTLKNPDAEFRKAGRLILGQPRNGAIT
ncbi:unnamed protein product [Hermetia illucens]|uniref:Cytochrome P450 n=1 Tax=Hermetia illucens TaxID=343691 RepID=A0A7R8UF47_HERIL|nr:unnamed protein product [Hermetia illucens]